MATRPRRGKQANPSRKRKNRSRPVITSEAGAEKSVSNLQRLNTRIYTTIQDPIKHVRLRSISAGTISGAATNVSKRWNPNSAYTPIVGGSSGALPGWADWANLYNHYRVIGYKVHFSAVNLETFGVSCSCLNTDDDPGTAAVLAVSANRYSWTTLLSSKGGGHDCWTFSQPVLTVSQIVGSNMPRIDESFSANTASSPTDLIYFTIGINSTAGSNLTNGIAYKVDLEMFVDFYQPQIQS